MVIERRAETLKQVAASFGASYDTFFRAYQAKRIKVIRFGNRLFVPKDEIERIGREGLSPKPATPADLNLQPDTGPAQAKARAKAAEIPARPKTR
jgi:hypothetical protein